MQGESAGLEAGRLETESSGRLDISQAFLLSVLGLRQREYTFPHGFAALMLKGRWRKYFSLGPF